MFANKIITTWPTAAANAF